MIQTTTSPNGVKRDAALLCMQLGISLKNLPKISQTPCPYFMTRTPIRLSNVQQHF